MTEHRNELREKVELQQDVLEKALRESEAANHPADRISALSTQLSVVSDALSGGWQQMTDATAERLSHWLVSTRFLVPNEKPKMFAKPDAPPLAVEAAPVA